MGGLEGRGTERRRGKNIQHLKTSFEELYRTYSSSYLFSDPLWFVHQYTDPLDQEVVAFLSSALAYGNVTQILNTLRKLLVQLGDHPARFVLQYDPTRHFKLFYGIYHRFHSPKDFQILIYLLSHLYRRYGTLAKSFERHFEP